MSAGEVRTQAAAAGTIYSGTACTECGTTYARCTRRVPSRPHLACCGACGNRKTHDEVPVGRGTAGVQEVEQQPCDPLEPILRSASGKGLLDTFAALTHRMHATETYSEENTYREQRDLVQAEILRRMDGATS